MCVCVCGLIARTLHVPSRADSRYNSLSHRVYEYIRYVVLGARLWVLSIGIAILHSSARMHIPIQHVEGMSQYFFVHRVVVTSHRCAVVVKKKYTRS